MTIKTSKNAKNEPNSIDLSEDFFQESLSLIAELENIMIKVKDTPSEAHLFGQYSQIIDRIMGAAKILNYTKIGDLCELGKSIGQKSAQLTASATIRRVTRLLSDNINLIKKMIKRSKLKRPKRINKIEVEELEAKLKRLSKDLNITLKINESEKLSQNSINEYFKDFGP